MSHAVESRQAASAKLLPSDRILVIGGNGFIGRHLVKQCVEAGAHITVWGLQGQGFDRLFGGKARFQVCDLSDAEAVKSTLKGESFEYVFNLGGYIDHTLYLQGGRRVVEQHLTGLFNLMDGLDRRTLNGFVQVGSSDEYGEAAAPQREVDRGGAINPYAFAKQAASQFVNMLADREGVPGVVVRPFLAYGPGQDAKRLLPQVIIACLKGETFACTLGEQQRDFCYVEDLAQGMVCAALAASARKGQAFNLASGQPVTIRAMIDTVVRLIGSGRPQFGARPYREGESMALYADVTKARSLLGWYPTTSLETGLTRTIAHHKERLT